jgi:hypothetical protein
MIKLKHMVHDHPMQSTTKSQRTRSISIDISHEVGVYNQPNVSHSSLSSGFTSTIFFKTVEQLQDYVNECRLALDDWMVEELTKSSIVAEAPSTK